MSLIPKLKIEWADNAKTLFAYDNTGENIPGGWGVGGNPTIASVLTATIVVTRPDGTVIAPIDVYPTLPNTNDIPFAITNAVLGYGTGTIVDGAYNFLYTIQGTFGGSPYTAIYNRRKFLYPTVCCCVSKLAAKVKSGDCGCESPAMETYSDAWDILELLKNAIKCSLFTEADEFLLQLQTICTNSNCGCS